MTIRNAFATFRGPSLRRPGGQSYIVPVPEALLDVGRLSRAVSNLAETARFTGLETGQAELGIGEACSAPVPQRPPRRRWEAGPS